MKHKEFLLEIAFKSGYSFQMWFAAFKINKSGFGGPDKIEYESAEDGLSKPLMLDINSITSVIQIKVREVETFEDVDVILDDQIKETFEHIKDILK